MFNQDINNCSIKTVVVVVVVLVHLCINFFLTITSHIFKGYWKNKKNALQISKCPSVLH